MENIAEIANPDRVQATAALMIDIDLIDPDPANSRPALRDFDWSDPRNLDPQHPRYEEMKAELEIIEELAANIETTTQLQPVILRHRGERYELVVGHRRLLAMKLLGRSSIFATLPRSLSVARAQFAENYHRRDLDLAGKLEAVERLLTEDGIVPTDAEGYTEKAKWREQAVKCLVDAGALSERQAFRYVRVIDATPDVKKAIADGRLSNLKHAVDLCDLEGAELEEALLALTGQGQDPGANIDETPAPKVKKEAPQRRGRPQTAVSVRVKNTNVVKTLVEQVMGSDAFPHVDWSDYSSAQKAFQQMLKHLEKRLSDGA